MEQSILYLVVSIINHVQHIEQETVACVRLVSKSTLQSTCATTHQALIYFTVGSCSVVLSDGV